jgi:hypothetical protein
MTKFHRFVAAALVVIPLSACAAQEQPENENLAAFGSIDEAYSAVNAVLDCDSDPAGEPTVPMGDGVSLAAAQKLCFENVQIDLYKDQEALREGYQLLTDTNQGPINVVQGNNWIVVDFSEMKTGTPSTRNIARLAKELQGRYAVVGS